MSNTTVITNGDNSWDSKDIEDIGDISFTVTQAANTLKMKVPTFKKYYNLIEKMSDYKFHRSDQGLVMFDKDDIEMFFRLKELKKVPKITLEKACEVLIEEYDLSISTNQFSSHHNGPSHELYEIVREQGKLLNQQGQLLKEITIQLQENKKETPILIEEAVKKKQKEMESSRDEQLMLVLREIQSVKKEMASNKSRLSIWKSIKQLLGLDKK